MADAHTPGTRPAEQPDDDVPLLKLSHSPSPGTEGSARTTNVYEDQHADGADNADGPMQQRRAQEAAAGSCTVKRQAVHRRCTSMRVAVAAACGVVVGACATAVCFVSVATGKAPQARHGTGMGGTPLQLSASWSSLAELKASPWHDYLRRVYADDLTAMAFPFTLLNLHMFHAAHLPRGVLESLRVREQDPRDARVLGRPMVFGELYRLWGGMKPVGVPWDQFNVWRCIYAVGVCEPPSGNGVCAATMASGYSNDAVHTGLASFTKVEVTHRMGDPHGSGMWFYWARGSGIYFVRSGDPPCLVRTFGCAWLRTNLLRRRLPCCVCARAVCRICAGRRFTATTKPLRPSAT